MKRFAPIIREAVKAQMNADNKNATGKTSRSIYAEPFETNKSIGINVGGGYGFPFIHTGRRPNATQPPYKAIAEWMQRKGVPYFAGSLNKSAYIIARSIGKKGFRGENISSKAVKRIINKLLDSTADAYIKDVEKHLKKYSKYARD